MSTSATSFSSSDLLATNVFSVKGRVVVLTGASSGMGHDMALTLAVNGAKVFAVGRKLEGLQKLVEEVKGTEGGGEIVPIQGDLSTLEAIRAWVELIAAKTEVVDVLINNAGIWSGLEQGGAANDPAQVQATLLSAKWDDFAEHSNVHVAGPYFTTALFIPLLSKSKSPSVIFNASTLGVSKSSPGSPAYDSSKAGILQVANTLSGRLMPLGIRVNSILVYLYPSGMSTVDSEAIDPWTIETLRMIPAHRFGQIENLAGTILFLSSKAAEYSNGLNINLDGGWLLTESAARFLPDKTA